MAKKNPKTDWAALKVEYIASNISQRALAEKHGIKAAGLMARASSEKWEAERKRFQAELSNKAISDSIPDRAEQLAQFNSEDVKVARALRSMIVKQMTDSKGHMDPNEIRILAGAAAEVQRIGRLALGAETESTAITTRVLEPLPDDAFLG